RSVARHRFGCLDLWIQRGCRVSADPGTQSGVEHLHFEADGALFHRDFSVNLPDASVEICPRTKLAEGERMSVRALFTKVCKTAVGGACRSRGRRAPLQLEALETRLVLYSVSGNAWPHPELITLSFI